METDGNPFCSPDLRALCMRHRMNFTSCLFPDEAGRHRMFCWIAQECASECFWECCFGDWLGKSALKSSVIGNAETEDGRKQEN